MREGRNLKSEKSRREQTQGKLACRPVQACTFPPTLSRAQNLQAVLRAAEAQMVVSQVVALQVVPQVVAAPGWVL